jgi:hypothetical protein
MTFFKRNKIFNGIASIIIVIACISFFTQNTAEARRDSLAMDICYVYGGSGQIISWGNSCIEGYYRCIPNPCNDDVVQ